MSGEGDYKSESEIPEICLFPGCKFCAFLYQRYISILSISGRHSHRLDPLIEKRCLPTLVIADLDSASIFRTNIRISLDIHIRLWYNKKHE